MTLEENKIKALTDELNRYKKKAFNRRRAIKDLQRNHQLWQETARRYLAMYEEMKFKHHEQGALTWYIAKARAIEAGLVTEKDTKHAWGVKAVREWLDARMQEYLMENGIIK